MHTLSHETYPDSTASQQPEYTDMGDSTAENTLEDSSEVKHDDLDMDQTVQVNGETLTLREIQDRCPHFRGLGAAAVRETLISSLNIKQRSDQRTEKKASMTPEERKRFEREAVEKSKAEAFAKIAEKRAARQQAEAVPRTTRHEKPERKVETTVNTTKRRSEPAKVEKQATENAINKQMADNLRATTNPDRQTTEQATIIEVAADIPSPSRTPSTATAPNPQETIIYATSHDRDTETATTTHDADVTTSESQLPITPASVTEDLRVISEVEQVTANERYIHEEITNVNDETHYVQSEEKEHEGRIEAEAPDTDLNTPLTPITIEHDAGEAETIEASALDTQLEWHTAENTYAETLVATINTEAGPLDPPELPETPTIALRENLDNIPEEELTPLLSEIEPILDELEPTELWKFHHELLQTETLLEELIATYEDESSVVTDEADHISSMEISTELLEDNLMSNRLNPDLDIAPTILATAELTDDAMPMHELTEKLVTSFGNILQRTGIDYDEQDIRSIVIRLVNETAASRMDTQQQAEAFDRGTHENLIRLLGQIKQLRTASNGVHRFLGKFAASHIRPLEAAA